MKKLILMALVVVMAVTLIISACSGPAPTTTTQAPAPAPTTKAPAPATSASPAPAPTTSAAPAPITSTAPATTQVQTKVIELKYADWNPPVAPVSKLTEQWAQKVEKDTGGRVKITLYMGESLIKETEIYKAVQNGTVDIGSFVIGNMVGMHDLNWFQRLPFMTWPGGRDGNAIYRDIFNKTPALQQEFTSSGVKIFSSGMRMLPGFQLHTTKKQVKVPTDLQGMKIITSQEWLPILSSVGAAPLTQGPADWYTSLDRGLAGGQLLFFNAMNVFKLLDIIKYSVYFGPGGAVASNYVQIMNPAKFNSLPPDIQKILEDDAAWLGDAQTDMDVKDEAAAMEIAKQKGITIYNPTPDEMKLWTDLAKISVDKWIADTNAKGKPAQAVYDAAKQAISAYWAKNPPK